MVATGYELLYYFTYDHNSRVKWGLRHGQELRLRERALAKNLDEDKLAWYLEKIGCRKLLDKCIIPAVLESKHGRKWDERTVLYDIKQDDYPEFDISNILNRTKSTGYLPDPKTIRRICRRGHYKVIRERTTLDSIWQYDPCGVSGVRADVFDRMIHV